MAYVKITITDKDDGDLVVDADFENDVTKQGTILTNAERLAAGILYRLNNSPGTWLETDDDADEAGESSSDE